MKGMFKKVGFVMMFFSFSALGGAAKSEAATTKAYPDPPQSVYLDPKLFVVPNGADSYLDKNDHVLVATNNEVSQVGSIFSTNLNRIDLTQDFHSEMFIYIDGNADGVAFVMHNDPSKLINFVGQTGRGLGVYAGDATKVWGAGIELDGSQMRNSFVIEFDTFFNDENEPSGLNYELDPKTGKIMNLNGKKGHIAYLFPDKKETYSVLDFVNPGWSPLAGVFHHGIQYPSEPLGGAKWRQLTIDWKAWDKAGKGGSLTYQFDVDGYEETIVGEASKLRAITVPIDKDIFGEDHVYWGFTGSTGAEYEKAAIAFKSVPGLVNFDENLVVKDKQDREVTTVAQDSEVTIHYTGTYTGGRQPLENPKLEFQLDKKQRYQPDTFFVDGISVTPVYNSEKNILSWTVNDTLDLSNSELKIKFNVKDFGLEGDAKLTVKSKLESLNLLTDKEVSYNVGYVPNTPPTATPDIWFTSGGSAAVTALRDPARYPSMFAEFSDDHTPNEKLNFTLKPGEDEKIPDMMSKMGVSYIWIRITDEDGAFDDFKVPIFVGGPGTVYSDVEDGKGSVSYVEVSGGGSSTPVSPNFTLKSSEVPSDPSDLTSLLPFKKHLHDKVSLSVRQWYFHSSTATVTRNPFIEEVAHNDVKYEITGLLDQDTEHLGDSDLTLPLKYPKYDKLNMVIQFTDPHGDRYGTERQVLINPVKAALKVNFVNEENNAITVPNESAGPLVVSYDLYDTVDLTQDAKISGIRTKIENMGMQLVAGPIKETSYFVQTEAEEVTYQFEGTLFLESIPKILDFGVNKLNNSQVVRVDKVKTGGDSLVIADTRVDKKWTLKAKLTKPLKTASGKEIHDAIRYKSEGKDEFTLTDQAQILLSKQNPNERYNVSDSWGSTQGSQGFKLEVNAVKIKELGKYTGEVEYLLEDVYTP